MDTSLWGRALALNHLILKRLRWSGSKLIIKTTLSSLPEDEIRGDCLPVYWHQQHNFRTTSHLTLKTRSRTCSLGFTTDFLHSAAILASWDGLWLPQSQSTIIAWKIQILKNFKAFLQDLHKILFNGPQRTTVSTEFVRSWPGKPRGFLWPPVARAGLSGPKWSPDLPDNGSSWCWCWGLSLTVSCSCRHSIMFIFLSQSLCKSLNI